LDNYLSMTRSTKIDCLNYIPNKNYNSNMPSKAWYNLHKFLLFNLSNNMLGIDMLQYSYLKMNKNYLNSSHNELHFEYIINRDFNMKNKHLIYLYRLMDNFVNSFFYLLRDYEIGYIVLHTECNYQLLTNIIDNWQCMVQQHQSC
jgi:hypothetical protein